MAGSRPGRVPAWALLAALVTASFLLRLWLGSKQLGPFILVDELIYSEVARSIADGAGLLVRGEQYSIASVLYPLLIAPAYALFDSLPTAYAVVKGINALLMSLAAVPAYLLGRRVLPARLAFIGAGLAILLPSLVYSGSVMTENAFYPAFLLVAWQLVRVLERPTAAGQLVLLLLCGLTVLIRVQAIALVLAALTAPLLLRAVARRPLRPFALLYVLVLGGGLALVALQLARGASLSALLGTYAVVGEGGYDVANVLRFLLWHVEELDLYVGVIPVAAFLVLLGRWRSLDAPAQAFLAAAVALLGWIVLVVAAFASRFANAIEERNMFVVAPLLLIALLVWVDRGAPRPRTLATLAAFVAALLPAYFPYERFIESKARSDTLMLIPLWNLQDEITLPRVDEVVYLAALGAALLFLLVPRRLAVVLPLVVGVYFVAALRPIDAGSHGVRIASAGAVFTGIGNTHRDWIDRAVPEGAEVAVLWTGRTDRFTVFQNEFFNRSLGPVYTIGGALPGYLPETPVRIDETTGVVERADDSPVETQYVLTDGSVAPDGVPVASDPRKGLTVYRVPGRIVSTTSVEGLEPDGWSGPTLTYRRVKCGGGTLTVSIRSDRSLFTRPQTVHALVGGKQVASAFVRPSVARTLAVPLTAKGGTCEVEFRIDPTAVPAEVTNGANPDTRELGVRFDAFDYSASPRGWADEDRLRRLAALAFADRGGELHPRLARRPGGGGGREARDRGLRSDEPGREDGDPAGARGARRRVEAGAAAALPALAGRLEPPRSSATRAGRGPVRRLPLLRLDVSAAGRRRPRHDGARPRPAPLPGVGDAEDPFDAQREVRRHLPHVRPRLRQLRLHGRGRGRAARRRRRSACGSRGRG